MKTFRIAMIALALLQALLVSFGMLIGAFADGGYWWERLPMLIVHPAAAVALLALTLPPRPPVLRWTVAALALLSLNLAADAAMSVAIGAGFARGDWWLPLVFSVIPAVVLVFTLATMLRPRPPAGPVAAAGNRLPPAPRRPYIPAQP